MTGRTYGRGLWVAVAAVLAVSVAWAPSGLPDVCLCFFHRLTGLPCAGCGLSHSFCAISHGQFAAAWAYNPFGYVFYAAAVVFLLCPLLARLSSSFERAVIRPRALVVVAPLLVAAMWVFGVLRIVRLLSV